MYEKVPIFELNVLISHYTKISPAMFWVIYIYFIFIYNIHKEKGKV